MAEPIFGPDGKVRDRDALRSVGLRMGRLPLPRTLPDGTKRQQWLNENDGGIGGTDTHHKDGRVDVQVDARPAILEY